jgi:MvdC family ATP-grasp ribosomal peptide maturase
MPEPTENRKIVLILTHTADHFTVDRVADALLHQSVLPVRFNTDTFPAESRLIAQIANQHACHELHLENMTVRSDDVHGVWLRKLWKPKLDEQLDPNYRQYCERESLAALLGFLDSLHHARWIDRPDRMQRAEDKLHQLRLATECGLTIPRTLVTNDPGEVRAMFRELNGSMVAKMLTPMTVSMGRPSAFVYTTKIKADDLDHLDSLRYCPMVFQELIDKAFELRIACVNGQCFTGRIDASGSADGAVDWRRADPSECSWQPAELPDEVQTGLSRLMQNLGLSFGAIDVIVTPDGQHVFLEVNPGGEWGMLERDLGLPISEAIANTLVGHGSRP